MKRLFVLAIALSVGAMAVATEAVPQGARVATPVATPVATAIAPTTAKPLPSDSILQLGDTFTAQDGRTFTLAERRGKPQLVAMFYSSCKFMCPLLVDSARGVDHALSPSERARMNVLFVSIDPARDTPPVLAALAAKRKLDLSRWTLARTDDASVRKLAALLGVRYRKLADGDFNHTSALILLDADGRIIARTEKMGAVPDPEFMKVVKKALQ
jgi:protein SCO1/2